MSSGYDATALFWYAVVLSGASVVGTAIALVVALSLRHDLKAYPNITDPTTHQPWFQK